MTTIKQEDFIQSIADHFQFISNYHPVDFITAMGQAYEREQSPAAKSALVCMEAIHEFDVRDMPVTVAVDTTGDAAHESGPREWRARIGKIPVTVV